MSFFYFCENLFDIGSIYYIIVLIRLGCGYMKNEDFKFLDDLNQDLYKRYLMIEDALKNKNGNVYVEIQAFLENLFKYINKREGYNLVQTKTLGDFLKNHKIITFCLVRIEYNDINILKKINYYGNNHKHQKVIEFKFTEFIKFIREIHLISRKVYNYYKKDFVNNIKGINEEYYTDLLLKEQRNKEKQESYQSNISCLSEAITDKYKEIALLKDREKENEKSLIKLQKELRLLNIELSEFRNENNLLKSNGIKLKADNKLLVEQLKNLQVRNKLLKSQNNTLENYKNATEDIIPQLLKKESITNIIDDEIIQKIIMSKY